MPLRRWRADPDHELIGYLGWLGDRVDTIVVDGSGPEVFAAHRRWFGSLVTHVPVDADLTGRYGKVNGVITGVRAASHERVVIADDDVRYDTAGLERMARLLEHADLVRPQNYFEPLPWHARWDTARTLVNRAFGADYPGTLGVRRSRLLEVDGYDGDCLFENLELIRTIETAGGRVVSPLDFYVRRLPPPARHFWSQRVRQAYDDFALPARMAVELAVVPGVVVLLARRRPRALAAPAVLAMAIAEVGRRRAGGAHVFPATCSLLAPAWLGERGVCAWLAVWNRLVRGGVPYAGTVLSKAANSRRELERRLASEGGSAATEPRLSSAPRARPDEPCPDPCR
ncbi:MAG: glycosyltransferase family 2 protein [Actinomycetota bacterium]|nr:glycosyltransferase family 2 protein [Actinomycetota bacterium]MDQ3573946.1 glycosyltransferase family 2 protein [Actinomycetota bacterium]